jgi:hypothetical protein
LHDVGRVGRVRGQQQRQGVQQVGVAQRGPQEVLDAGRTGQDQADAGPIVVVAD